MSEPVGQAGGSSAAVVVTDGRARDDDLRLLRAYEPIVRYTQGELFFPTAVGAYVAQCSLWAGARGGAPTLVVPAGELTLERLSEEGVAHRDRALFLRFVEKPLGRAEYMRWRLIPRDRLSSAGRLTTTGVFGRLMDAGLRASLLLRGKVPSGWPRPRRAFTASGWRPTGSRITAASFAMAATCVCSTGSFTQ
ncbi:MAG: hypothetical protein JO046_26995 [Solirubrobacterales bacterium]|nr:hypothetical protein [Solirubrobacterales bacterium]